MIEQSDMHKLIPVNIFNRWLTACTLCAVIAFAVIALASPVKADATPEQAIGGAVQNLLDEFSLRRGELKNDRPALYAMVDRVTRPYFDFEKISKLVLAKSWKKASVTQRQQFGEEFRKLLIRSYATALFQYTGDEKMAFKVAKIKERKGVKSAVLQSEIKLREGPGIAVNYSLIQDKGGSWKIYNMDIAGVNLVTNYRKTYGASIRSQGLDGLIDSIKKSNNAG
jgi:phospholipid transport system substrate-binding protein